MDVIVSAVIPAVIHISRSRKGRNDRDLQLRRRLDTRSRVDEEEDAVLGELLRAHFLLRRFLRRARACESESQMRISSSIVTWCTGGGDSVSGSAKKEINKDFKYHKPQTQTSTFVRTGQNIRVIIDVVYNY